MPAENPRPQRGPDVSTWVENDGGKSSAHLEVQWDPNREVAWLREFIQTRKKLEKEFTESAVAALDYKPTLAIIEARKVLDLPNISGDYFMNAGVVEDAVGVQDEDPIKSMFKADHAAFDLDPEIESTIKEVIKTAREQIKGNEESEWSHGNPMSSDDNWGSGIAFHEEARARLENGSTEMAMRSYVHADTYLRKKAVEVSGEETMKEEIIGMEVRDQRAVVLYELADIYKTKGELTGQQVKDLIYLVINLVEVGPPRNSSQYEHEHLRLLRNLSKMVENNSHRLTLQRARAKRLTGALNYLLRIEVTMDEYGNSGFVADPYELVHKRLGKFAKSLEQ